MNNQIKLQGITQKQEGTKIKDLKIGDILIWNYGYKSEVVELIPSKTGKTYTIKSKSLQDGVIRDRNTTANRLVVVDKKDCKEEISVETVKETVPKVYKNVEKRKVDPIQKAIDNRETTHYGIYSDIGTALDKFTTMELADFYIEICGTDSALRYYIEQEIIKNEIYKQRAV